MYPLEYMKDFQYKYNKKEKKIMSKYDTLWQYVQNEGQQSLRLTFEEIEKVAGIPIDHSFLTYKKRTDKIRLSGRKNINERADRHVP